MLTSASSTRPASPSAPDRGRILAWLSGPRVLDGRARVLSWVNPAHPGYPYPEAAALWLSWAAWRRESGQPGPTWSNVGPIAEGLRRDMRGGVVGRGSQDFLFDSCLALYALARLHGAYGAPAPDLASRLPQLRMFLEQDCPVLPLAAAPPRWSSLWTGHLDRGAALLYQAGSLCGSSPARDLALDIRARTRRASVPLRYTHALLYAAEGELLFRALGCSPGALEPGQVARQLQALQSPDGALSAWTDGSGGPRVDATAQALRLWAALDRRRFALPIARATAYLARRQTPEGALPYGAGQGDKNTWVTVFADQALSWAGQGARVSALI